MDWTADPLGEIDRRIRQFEDDRLAWQHQLEDANRAEVRAVALVDAAHAAGDLARLHVRDDDTELAFLREDRAVLVPGQRQP